MLRATNAGGVPMSNLENFFNHLARQVKGYFGAPLGEFYAHTANRLMLYPFIAGFFFTECVAFWALFQGPAFLLDHLAFSIVYSLHKAVLYTSCLLGADVLANWLFHAWGSYAKRRVGRQWIIWSMGLVAAFLLHRSMITSLVVFYAPDVVGFFRAYPEAIPSRTTVLMILLPYFCIVVFTTLQIARNKLKIQRMAAAVTAEPPDAGPGQFSRPAAQNGLPAGRLRLENGGGNDAIALADITHVSVEDHYCRINYATAHGLKNVLIRLPLAELMRKLPREHFLQTHRSHVVNLGHVSRLRREGRQKTLVLARHGVELPISRQRFKQVEPRLKVNGCG